MKGRVIEAMRLSNAMNKLPVYVYIRYVYTDSLNLLSEVKFAYFLNEFYKNVL